MSGAEKHPFGNLVPFPKKMLEHELKRGKHIQIYLAVHRADLGKFLFLLFCFTLTSLSVNAV